MIDARFISARASFLRASLGAMRLVHTAVVEYVEFRQPGTAEFLHVSVWAAYATCWTEAAKRFVRLLAAWMIVALVSAKGLVHGSARRPDGSAFRPRGMVADVSARRVSAQERAPPVPSGCCA